VDDRPGSPWWTDLNPRWTADDAEHLADLLMNAYPDRTTIEPFAAAVGFIFPEQADNSDMTAESWRQILHHAARHHKLGDLIARLLSSQSGSGSTGELFGILITAAGDGGALETISGVGGPTEFGAWMEAFDRLRVRLAQVRIDGRESGTGVLVGNNLILTAGHVIEKPTGEVASPASIEVAFDFFYQPGKTHDETGQVVRVTGVICHSPPTEAERSTADWHDDVPEDQVDYAIVELVSHAPEASMHSQSISRGYYQIHFVSYNFQAKETLFVGHFPQGSPASVSTAGSTRVHHSERRIRYESDTMSGSSGGPIVNANGRLVAIHHYGAATYNRGVPVYAIARDLQAKGLDYLFNQADEENVSHLGRYSLNARDQICQSIASNWRAVTKHVAVPDFISGSYAVWDWLSSHNQLRKLRDALMETGYIELVSILDQDIVIVDSDTVNHLNDLAGQLAESARASETPSNYRQEVTKARLLSGTLLRKIEMLLAMPDDARARLQWRKKWRGTLDHAASHLGELLNLLPSSGAEAGYSQFSVIEINRYSEEINSAVSTLQELARNPSLYA
jgi:hypothetical protein